MKKEYKIEQLEEIKKGKKDKAGNEIYPSGKYILRRPDGSRKVITINREPSKTDQSFAADCDVNKIMARYRKGVPLPTSKRIQGYYADVSDVGDIVEMEEKMQAAKEDFQQIPAKIRKMFNNDIHELARFLKDPLNDTRAIELGLKEKPKNADQSPGQTVTSAGTNDVGGGSGSQENIANQTDSGSN